jgi:hypothetical protein
MAYRLGRAGYLEVRQCLGLDLEIHWSGIGYHGLKKKFLLRGILFQICWLNLKLV